MLYAMVVMIFDLKTDTSEALIQLTQLISAEDLNLVSKVMTPILWGCVRMGTKVFNVLHVKKAGVYNHSRLVKNVISTAMSFLKLLFVLHGLYFRYIVQLGSIDTTQSMKITHIDDF